VTTTTCKTASGSSSSGRETGDDEEEKILDTDQKRKLASISEDEEEDEEEEEEEGNPLPTTQQQLEHAQDQDNKVFQQLEQQQHDEELQDEEPAEQEQEDKEAVWAEQLRGAGVEAAAIMAKECKMTPRLQFWYENSKDRTSIELWCDAVDRIWDQKGWNNDAGKKPAASVAVNSLREEASLLMSIIAKGHQAAEVKDWSLMKPILVKRYSTIKTCPQGAKQFATLTHKSGEPVENFYDGTQMAMIIVHKKARAAIPVAEVERLRGYNKSANGTQALQFVAGLLPYLKTFVDYGIEESPRWSKYSSGRSKESSREEVTRATASTPCRWRSTNHLGKGRWRQK
jgi:hypothetical protein